MKCLLQGMFSFLIILFPIIVFASSPLGLWETYDLQHRPRDIIKIIKHDDELLGVIVKSKDARLVGKKIIWGLTFKNDQWENGYVLSVDDGNIYRCRIKISEDNRTLFFSPYKGIPLFGITIKWSRIT